jgi:hypothetical protein
MRKREFYVRHLFAFFPKISRFFAFCCSFGIGLSPLGVLGMEPPDPRPANSKSGYQAIARKEALRQGVPYELVDAVMYVESRYRQSAKGRAGEVGLMQIMPPTARLLGFRGNNDELRKPETNIRLGTTYLAQAWQRASKDICTAVMKYRAGHNETRFSVLSVNYCRKVRKRLKIAGYPVTGKVPKATFGFRHAASGGVRSRKCFARVVQAGPNFGKCIPLSLLVKMGLVVKTR